MNTVKSVYYGWATLIVAGGGAYFFAKRSINADRAHKAELDRQKRARIYEMEHGIQAPPTTPLNPTARPGSTQAAPQSVTSELGRLRSEGGGNGGNGGMGQTEGNPSVQASQDPAPTRHAPTDEGQRVGEKSKYEASDVYRSRKGDRFS